MAWTSPSDLSTGTLVTAAAWNASLGASGNTAALRAGGISLASQAVGDIVYGSSTTQLGRVSIGTANQLLTSSGSAPQWSSNIDVPGTLDVTSHAALDATLSIGYGSVGDYQQILVGGTLASGGGSSHAEALMLQTAITGATGDTAWLAGAKIGPAITTQASETIVHATALIVNEPEITKGSGATVTTASTLWIANQPTEGERNAGLVATGVVINEESPALPPTVQGSKKVGVYIGGQSNDDPSCAVLTLGDDIAGASRQWSLVNGRSSAEQSAGNLLFLAADAISKDPLDGAMTAMVLDDNGDLAITGALSKGSGSFKIDHPLPGMSSTHHLVHSFVESNEALLCYRGTATLSAGSASCDLDEVTGMSSGTWERLCRDESCFTTNETGWHHVRGTISGSTLTIDCEEACDDVVSWLVVASRADQHMYDTSWCDADGYPIVEPEKDATYTAHCTALQAIKDAGGDVNVSTSDPDPARQALGQWLHDARSAQRKGTLAAERVSRLEALGVWWSDPSIANPEDEGNE